MTEPIKPQTVAFDGIIALGNWFIKHPISRAVFKNNRAELLNDRDPKYSTQSFIESFVVPVFENNCTGDETIEFVEGERKLHSEGKLDRPNMRGLYFLLIALAYYAQAIKAEDNQTGWMQVAEGKYWHGFLVGLTDENDFALSKSNTKAANASHVEDRQMKEQVIEWYYKEGVKLPTKDKAAAEAQKIVAMKFSTIRNWLKRL